MVQCGINYYKSQDTLPLQEQVNSLHHHQSRALTCLTPYNATHHELHSLTIHHVQPPQTLQPAQNHHP